MASAGLNESYSNPSIDANKFGSPMDQAMQAQTDADHQANAQRALANGHANGQTGGGRTLQIPKYLPAGEIPGPSYNNAVSIGAECNGPHCSSPISPTSPKFYPQNPSMVRLGNSSLQTQQGGSRLLAYGQIRDPRSGEVVDCHSDQGRQVYHRYLQRVSR